MRVEMAASISPTVSEVGSSLTTGRIVGTGGLRFNFPWYLALVPRFARHPPLTGKVGSHEHETPVQSLCGLRYRLGDGDRPDRKASVCDEQLLQRQPDLPCRLVDWDLAVIACVCSNAISPPAGGQG
jgi:hypothetical protein